MSTLGKTQVMPIDVMPIDKEWQGADPTEIVHAEMSPYAGRVQIEGPRFIPSPRAAQSFALALHELATNAAKYGALSNTTGRVHITWSQQSSSGADSFAFRWQEHGGPAVRAPAQKGFGSAVLEQIMAEHEAVPPRIEFATAGIIYELSGSLEAAVPEDRQAPSRAQ